jgi:two-component system response regulator AtoC
MQTDRKLKILLVDDEEIVHQTMGDYLRDSGVDVVSKYDGRDGLDAIDSTEYDLTLVDIRMPRMDGLSFLEEALKVRPDLSVVIITGHGSMEIAVQALRLGAADFLTKPLKLLELDAVLEKAMRLTQLRQDRRHLRETIRGIQEAEGLSEGSFDYLGTSAATQMVREQVRRAVEAECDTILVTGETGTGKEVVAREIHHQSFPAEQPFIAVSCPALPDSLVESELFGHVKGAFTGAQGDRAGYFELADEGTLFLDEVGDLSDAAQAKLLRVLETRALRRVGGAREISVDVRVIAATNRPLMRLVEEGTFRSDLYYRLNIYTIELTPLRDRTEDIPILAKHFLGLRNRGRAGKAQSFSSGAEKILMEYHFPGNARELRNLVERAAILCSGNEINQGSPSSP